MGMIVIFGALFIGLTAAVIAQIIVAVFNMKSRAETLLVGGTFIICALVSAKFIAKVLGVQ